MAELSVKFPPGQSDRIIDALCKAGGFHGLKDADRRAREEFARRYVAQFVRITVARIEQTEAMADVLADVTPPAPQLDIT